MRQEDCGAKIYPWEKDARAFIEELKTERK